MDVIPIVEVDVDNFAIMKTVVLSAVRMAQYVSIDLELSGLGEKPDIRYNQLKSK